VLVTEGPNPEDALLACGLRSLGPFACTPRALSPARPTAHALLAKHRPPYRERPLCTEDLQSLLGHLSDTLTLQPNSDRTSGSLNLPWISS
jgi:hypothetical protein